VTSAGCGHQQGTSTCRPLNQTTYRIHSEQLHTVTLAELSAAMCSQSYHFDTYILQACIDVFATASCHASMHKR